MDARATLRRALPALRTAATPGGALGRETELPPLAPAPQRSAARSMLDTPHDDRATPGGRAGATPQAPPAAPLDGVQGRWRFPSLFWAFWLFYLYFPLKQAVLLDTSRGWLGVAAILLFAAIYTGWFVRIRAARRAGEMVPTSSRWAVLAAMIGLTVVATIGVGDVALTMLTYVSVVAAMTLPARKAWALIAAMAVTTVLVPLAVPGWPLDWSVPGSIAVAGLAMWGVSQLIMRNYELAAARDEIGRLAVEEERARFARDLHDILGHSLTVVTVKAELAGRLVHVDPDRAEREITEVEQLARDALADVRAAIGGYRQVTLATELLSARSALGAAGIEADLSSAVDAVPGERRELFGWAVREGVTNVVRHSEATRCTVRVTRNSVTVTDDGRGSAVPPTGSGHRVGNGLRGLAERAAAAGAALRTGTGPDGYGFRLEVTFA